jgi:hypothetical protein
LWEWCNLYHKVVLIVVPSDTHGVCGGSCQSCREWMTLVSVGCMLLISLFYKDVHNDTGKGWSHRHTIINADVAPCVSRTFWFQHNPSSAIWCWVLFRRVWLLLLLDDFYYFSLGMSVRKSTTCRENGVMLLLFQFIAWRKWRVEFLYCIACVHRTAWIYSV